MPENRKYFINKGVHLISTRTEEGLPLVASFNLNFIIWGVLARARAIYDVKICHFIFMYNHLHLLIVVNDPEAVSHFMRYLKSEIAHAVNRLLGRQQRTIWKEGYDSPQLLTVKDVIRYIRYIYLNPPEACLEESIDAYPGVSSWEMFYSGNLKRQCGYVNRDDILPLPSPALSINEQKELLRSYEGAASSKPFVLEPYAWVECFTDADSVDIEEIRNEIITSVRAKEAELGDERRCNRRGVIGATALRRQSMLREHAPKKHSRKMICICSQKDLRKDFIAHYREKCELARRAYRAWKRGDFRLTIPAGLFAPRRPTLISALPLLI